MSTPKLDPSENACRIAEPPHQCGNIKRAGAGYSAMRRRSLLAVATACLGGLAGCSGGGEEPGTDTDGGSPAATDEKPGDGPASPSGTATVTPMPEAKYAARLTVEAEESGLDGEFAVVTDGDGAPYLRYETVKGRRGDQRERARSAYDALVKQGPVGRDLDARVVNGDTGERWYRWNAKEEWARAYVSGELSEGTYQQKIDKTVREWS